MGLKDDGTNIVETSFLYEGLFYCRAYFTQDTPDEQNLRDKILWMWEGVERNWFAQGSPHVLYWHWRPNNGWRMNPQTHGWNEGLIAYVLAASPNYAINRAVYDQGWASGAACRNGNTYYNTVLPLGPKKGGPLFFSRSSSWASTYTACRTSTRIISSRTWPPRRNSLSWKLAMRHFHDDLGGKHWSEYGFYDAFSESYHWVASSQLAIDQGLIVAMLKNRRSGLRWKLFMNAPEAQRGLKRLGFERS